MQGARHGTRSWVSRITPWAEGSAKLLSHPGCPLLGVFDPGYIGFPVNGTEKPPVLRSPHSIEGDRLHLRKGVHLCMLSVIRARQQNGQDTNPNRGGGPERGRVPVGSFSEQSGRMVPGERAVPAEGRARAEAWRVATSVAVDGRADLHGAAGGQAPSSGALALPAVSWEPPGCGAGTGELRFALVTVPLTDCRAADRCWWAEGGPGRPILELFQWKDVAVAARAAEAAEM